MSKLLPQPAHAHAGAGAGAGSGSGAGAGAAHSSLLSFTDDIGIPYVEKWFVVVVNVNVAVVHVHHVMADNNRLHVYVLKSLLPLYINHETDSAVDNGTQALDVSS